MRKQQKRFKNLRRDNANNDSYQRQREARLVHPFRHHRDRINLQVSSLIVRNVMYFDLLIIMDTLTGYRIRRLDEVIKRIFY